MLVSRFSNQRPFEINVLCLLVAFDRSRAPRLRISTCFVGRDRLYSTMMGFDASYVNGSDFSRISLKRPAMSRMLTKHRALVEEHMELMLKCVEAQSGSLRPYVDQGMLDPIRSAIGSGGKRWRSALMLTMLEGLQRPVGKTLDSSAFAVAAAIEMVHAGSIIHDDIEDDSSMRRGQPCLHKAFGVDVALNAGSVCYFVAQREIAKVAPSLLPQFAEYMLSLHTGQGVDILWHKSPKHLTAGHVPSEEAYFGVAAGKTGSLAMMGADFAASLSGHTSDMEREQLVEFGRALGIAFQVLDDCLDLSSEEFHAGKGVAQDICEAKLSLPVIRTLTSAGSADVSRLRNILSLKTQDPVLVREAVEIIQRAGSIDYARQRGLSIIQNAWHPVSQLFSADSRLDLETFVKFVCERKT